jgi:hypothetical protein
MSDSEQITIYQLKTLMLGISPMIWRRVKVHSNSTITDLHYNHSLSLKLEIRLLVVGMSSYFLTL